ncbi:MAG: alpha/beta hydrolase [Phenylobacterium sp.]|nr:alpha/beta hydrolase [Phenylobacterium sp.]
MTERRGYADCRFGQIHYRRLGAGRPVILIHQTPWSSVQFTHAAPRLAAAGVEAISIDTPGYGLSTTPPEPPTIEDYADAIAEAIKGMGLERPAVAGHHTGALIAGALAARHPALVSRLALHGAPAYDAEERVHRLARKHGDHSLKSDGSHLTDRWAYLKALPGDRMSDEARQMAVLTYYLNGDLEWYGHTAAYKYDFGAAVPAIRCPTLVMTSRGDPIFGHGRRLASLRPDWSYAELDGSTEVIFDRPDSWAGPVAAFATA